MSDITNWSPVAAGNNTGSPDGFPEGMSPSGHNDSSREVMAAVRRQWEDAAWFNFGHDISRITATRFMVNDLDATSIYLVGRRVRATGSLTGTIYGSITASDFQTPNTVVDVAWDSGQMESETITISVGTSEPNSSLGLEIDARLYGVVADGSTDDAPGLNAAIAAAKVQGGAVVLPIGKMRCESDVVIDGDFVGLQGHWNASWLEFDGASLIVDPVASADPGFEGKSLTGWFLHNLRVSRIGTAGPAVVIDGDDAGGSNFRDATRWSIQNLHIKGSTGNGLEMYRTYLGTVLNLFVRECAGTGLVIDGKPATADVAVNAVGFFGGEIQDNGKAATLKNLKGVGFHSFTIEGNDEGVDLEIGSGITFDNIYLEANEMYDFRIGAGAFATPVRNITFSGCRFTTNNTIQLPVAIDAWRAENLHVTNCFFDWYATAAISRTNATTATSVSGTFDHLTLGSNGAQVFCEDENASFHQDPEEAVLLAELTWDAPEIGVGLSASTTTTVTGATFGDFVEVSASGGVGGIPPPLGMVDSADTVRIFLWNPTGANVDPVSRNYRIKVYPRRLWFD